MSDLFKPVPRTVQNLVAAVHMPSDAIRQAYTPPDTLPGTTTPPNRPPAADHDPIQAPAGFAHNSNEQAMNQPLTNRPTR
jgi:hypothetical protein